MLVSAVHIDVVNQPSVDGNPDGAPTSACGSMVPNHGGSSQSCSALFVVEANQSSFGTNEAVRITVRSTDTTTFKGLLLIAKRASDQSIVGTWSSLTSGFQTLSCGGVANTGVTHTSNSGKSQIQATWSSPSTLPSDSIVFRATIVRSTSVYYVNCFTLTLTPRQTNQSTSATTSASSTSATTANNLAGANIGWTYANQFTSVQMRVSSIQPGQYFALGLSEDEEMGGDHVFICRLLANGTVSLQRYVNPGGYSSPQFVSTSSNLGGTFIATRERYENGNVYCEFTLSNFANSGRRRRQNGVAVLSQTSSYHPLIAIGNLDSSNQATKHTIRTALSQNVQLNRQETIQFDGESDEGNVKLAKAHGIIMLFAWILFVSTGILLAQFFKKVWPERKICGKPIWFAMHRVMMLCATTFTIVGFILILIFQKGKWLSPDEPIPFAHSICGIIVISFAIIQPIMSIFRCTPDAQYRFIFNYVHGTVGYSAFLLSIVTIFLAMFFPFYGFEENREWGILVAWTCWVPFIFLLFGFAECHFRKEERTQVADHSYEMNSPSANGHAKSDPPAQQHNGMEDRIKTILLVIHILVALALSILLAVFIGRT